MIDRKVLAWSVHGYTALGGIVGLLAMFAAADGLIREAFLLLIITMLIDATDGMLARRCRVKEVLPHFDGAMVDNVIDFFTFVWIPVYIMGSQQVLPSVAWAAIPVIAALYAYGQVDMKSDDGFFIGFPSYWSIIALYIYWLQPSAWVAVLMVLIPGILTFIPTRYLYPSKGYVLWRTTWALGAIWFTLVIYLLSQEAPDRRLILISLLYPLYYMAASFFIDFKIRHQQRAMA